MSNENARRDENDVPVLMGISDDIAQERRMLRVDPITGRLLISDLGDVAGFTELVFTGTVDGANQDFTTTQKPTYVVSDGAFYKALDNNGVTQWTWSVNTVHMTIPPQSAIWGFV